MVALSCAVICSPCFKGALELRLAFQVTTSLGICAFAKGKNVNKNARQTSGRKTTERVEVQHPEIPASLVMTQTHGRGGRVIAGWL